MSGFKTFLRILGSIVAVLLIGCLIAFFVTFLLEEQGCVTVDEPTVEDPSGDDVGGENDGGASDDIDFDIMLDPDYIVFG